MPTTVTRDLTVPDRVCVCTLRFHPLLTDRSWTQNLLDTNDLSFVYCACPANQSMNLFSAVDIADIKKDLKRCSAQQFFFVSLFFFFSVVRLSAANDGGDSDPHRVSTSCWTLTITISGESKHQKIEESKNQSIIQLTITAKHYSADHYCTNISIRANQIVFDLKEVFGKTFGLTKFSLAHQIVSLFTRLLPRLSDHVKTVRQPRRFRQISLRWMRNSVWTPCAF